MNNTTNTNTDTTNRLRGRAGRRVAAALVAAAALGLGVTACGPDSGAAGAAGSSPSVQPTNGSSSGNSGAQGQNGGQSATAPSTGNGAGSGTGGSTGGGSASGGSTGSGSASGGSTGSGSASGGSTGSGSASGGGGVAHAGNHRTLIGKLQYLAPGKLTVKPQGGGMEQAFFIADDTKILGAAAICSVDDGTVTVGKDGYGSSKCTLDQLEKAAKTSSVTVRVTMDRKSGTANTVEEKYHP
ncbi:hypothetical protein CG747_11430 [Streptomyces sp. CB02959]|uniref:hypothetical protein n=1 Tax=Streptomyces sp. CB02959 TaxID=2020330 RepID=UPI000C277EA1|nr:hypothetical protein [Streptomyces sp. CB02959]PJN40308.1 hypothetical protein CG747_11430 [Streptomyces sp. CB02959]